MSAKRIAIVYGNFYKEEMAEMVNHTVDALVEGGIVREHITLHPVAGAFEIPLVGAALAHAGAVDALIGLGIIIEGQTHHARLIAENCARGMMDIQTNYRLPFVNEVLYVNSRDLAVARLSKGKDAAVTCIDSLAHLERIQS